MKPRLQIIRGLPGSGKSTRAAKWPHLLRLEADYYFQRGGQYAFGDARNKSAEWWLMGQISQTCQLGIDFVVCGVFAGGTTESLDVVVRMALESGYEVWIETMEADFGNVHGVRAEDYERMADGFVLAEELWCEYADQPDVHFGAMPSEFEIAPMEDGR